MSVIGPEYFYAAADKLCSRLGISLQLNVPARERASLHWSIPQSSLCLDSRKIALGHIDQEPLGHTLHEIAHVLCGVSSMVDEDYMLVVERELVRILADAHPEFSLSDWLAAYQLGNDFGLYLPEFLSPEERLAEVGEISASEFNTYVDADQQSAEWRRSKTAKELVQRLSAVPDESLRARLRALAQRPKC